MLTLLTQGSWKTTSTGLVTILGGIVRLCFAVKAGNVTEEAVMTTLIAIVTGLGLIYARDNNVTSEQVNAGKTNTTATPLIGLIALGGLLALAACAPLTPAPVAPGQDAVVVNAERIQVTALESFKQLAEWELSNRHTLPPQVTRAVDNTRREFPKAWRLSRKILADYKAARGPTVDDVNRVTAALSATQTALLTLRSDNSQTVQLAAAIAKLSASVTALKTP